MELEEIIKTCEENILYLFKLDKEVKNFINKNYKNKVNHCFAVGLYEDSLTLGELIKFGKTEYLSISLISLSGFKIKKNINLKNHNRYFIHFENEKEIKNNRHLKFLLRNYVKPSLDDLLDKGLVEKMESKELEFLLKKIYFHELAHSLYNSVDLFSKNHIPEYLKIREKKFKTYFIFVNELVAYSLTWLLYNLSKNDYKYYMKRIYKNFGKDQKYSLYNTAKLIGLCIAKKLNDLGIGLFKNDEKSVFSKCKEKFNSLYNTIKNSIFKKQQVPKQNKDLLRFDLSKYIEVFNLLYNTLNDVASKIEISKYEQDPLKFAVYFKMEFYDYIDKIKKRGLLNFMINCPIKKR